MVLALEAVRQIRLDSIPCCAIMAVAQASTVQWAGQPRPYTSTDCRTTCMNKLRPAL